ncbi:MAG: response regulator, partial [Candidatus Eremiobacteraeota bacterium]|nr:response regulator [Candidatus Eremiobacteraeota bacterium]
MTENPILVVDDDEIMRDALSDWLTDDGYKVKSVPDGSTALKVLEENRYSLMIVDLKMPGIDGLTVLREARVKYPDLNVIMITAYPTIDSAVEAIRQGAADYITKPFTPEQIEQAINNLTMEEEKPAAPAEALPRKSPSPEQHLAAGKKLYREGDLKGALKEFVSALKLEP